MKKLLYTVAQNINGELIKAAEANKGEDYCCPTCKGSMILRKSEKQLRRPHFAHKALTDNCTPETALHFAFKNFLFKRIDDCIKNQLPLKMKWECMFCDQGHEVDLLKKVRSAKIEATLDACKPDIVLFDENNKAIIAIEVVVTHSPEEVSLEYFRNNKIVLIRFDIEKEEDLDIIQKDILAPSSVLCCLNYPRCESCGSFMKAKSIAISDAECWKCGASMKIASPDRDKDGIPDKEQLNFLESKGIRIQPRSIRDWGEDYVNVCKHCNMFCGPVHEVDYFCGKYDLEEYGTGYRCPICHSVVKLPSAKFFPINRPFEKTIEAEDRRAQGADEEI